VDPRQFRVEGSSLAALRAQVAAEHGPRARIVAAEKVTVGGIRGLFSRQYFEVTVELQPDVPTEDTRRSRRARLDVEARLGIAALLADADEAEARIQGTSTGASVSTGSNHFAELMDDLTFNTVPPVAAAVPVPAAVQRPATIPVPLGGVGDLVVIVGLHQDAAAVATSMAALDRSGSTDAVERAGTLAGLAPGWDRRRALAARALGVKGGRAVFVAFGLESERNPAALAVQAETLRTIGADQLWVAVDAGRKAQDTANWVRSLAALLPVDGVGVVGAASTSSPETVEQLPLPVGWIDGLPVRRSANGKPDKLA
jgi:hypothetical protein